MVRRPGPVAAAQAACGAQATAGRQRLVMDRGGLVMMQQALVMTMGGGAEDWALAWRLGPAKETLMAGRKARMTAGLQKERWR